MERQIVYNYDEEGDILYVSFSPGEMGTGVELNDHILLRFNKEEKRAIGLTFLDFSVLIQRTEFGPRSFPLTGLADISDQMREIVMKLITTPPVSYFLTPLTYSPSIAEAIPILLVQKPPAEVAAA